MNSPCAHPHKGFLHPVRPSGKQGVRKAATTEVNPGGTAIQGPSGGGFSERRETRVALKPLFDLFLVFVVDVAQHQQDYPEGEKAQNAGESFQLPHIEHDHAAQGTGEHP